MMAGLDNDYELDRSRDDQRENSEGHHLTDMLPNRDLDDSPRQHMQ